MATGPTPLAQVKADLTADEAQAVAALRAAAAAGETDAAKLITDSKAAGGVLYTALQKILSAL